MPESPRLVDLIQLRIDEFLAEHRAQLTSIAPELGDVIDLAARYLAGGKRFRGLFCYWGWQSVAGRGDDLVAAEDASGEFPGIVLSAAALEVFHAAALVHDDIMDNSDTRRGAPSAHRLFEAIHRDGRWAGDGALYGRSAALLLGDLLLGWSDELLDRGAMLLPAGAARAGRAEFSRMRTEVTAGQYLDILEENAWIAAPERDALARAHRVIVYKSAKYTAEAPLAMGAALGGGTTEQLAALRAFGLPLGIAYQLRDDLLGVFGDPSVTGKPAGDDLREGKRTVLIAIARQKLPTPVRAVIDELLGDPDLDEEQVAVIRGALRECGAVDEIEQIIAREVDRALLALKEAPLSRSARDRLTELAVTVTRRDS